MTPQRSLQVSAAALVVAVVALLVAGAYAMGIIGTGQKLAPTDRSSQTGSLRAEGNLHVDRNATVSGSLDVTGPTTINDLIANGSTRLSSLHGTGAAQFESTLTATQGIFTVGSGRPPLVVGSSTLVPNLHANNSELLAGQPGGFYLDVSGAPQVKVGAFAVGSLTSGALVVNGSGSVGGPFSIGGPLTVGGLTSLNGSLVVPGTSTLGTLNTTANATIGGTASVGGNTTVSGNLTVNGTTTLAQLNIQNLSVANSGTFGGPLTVGGPTALSNSLTVAGPTTLQKGLDVTGDAAVTRNVHAGGTVTGANGLMATAGGLTVQGGGATINGDSGITGNLNVSGTITANTVNAGTGTITTLNSTTGNITTVNGITGNLTTLNSTTVNATTGNLTTVISTTVSATTGNIKTVNGITANFTGSTTLGTTTVSCPGGTPPTLSVCGNANVSGNLTTGTLTNSGTFTATGVINANGGISTSNAGPLNLTSANATVAVTGLLTTSNGATVSGGLLTSNAGFQNTGALTSTGGDVSLTGTGGSITINAGGTTVAGQFTANGGGTVNNGATLNDGTTLNGGATVNGLLIASNGATVNGGLLTANQGLTVNGAISAQGITNTGPLSSSGGPVSLSDAGNGVTVDGSGTTVTGNLTTGASNGTLTGYQLISTRPSACPLLGLCGLTLTPPLVVASHDQVTDLNANFLQGHPASDFALGGPFAPMTGSTSYIQNCSAPGNPPCAQAANLNLTNSTLAPNTVTAVLTSSTPGVDALQVGGSSSFTGSSKFTGGTTFNGATSFNTSLATFNAGFTVAAGVATFNTGLTVAAGAGTFKAGISVASGANTLLATGANDITLGTVVTPLTAFTVNATTTTVNGNAAFNGDAAFNGNVKITKDLVGGNFAGKCSWTVLPANQITCVTAVVGAPKAVIITPNFNGGAFYVDTLGTTGVNGSFVAHFPAGGLVLGDAVYYVVVR